MLTLGGTFQTAAGIMQAGLDDLIACPGIGPTKIRRQALPLPGLRNSGPSRASGLVVELCRAVHVCPGAAWVQLSSQPGLANTCHTHPREKFSCFACRGI